MRPMFVSGLLRRAAACILLTSVTVMSAACEDNDGIGVTPVETTRNISFSSSLQPGGFAWRSFNVERANAKITVQYVSIAPQADLEMRLGLGTFNGTECTIFSTVDVKPKADGPQITAENLASGDYCVRFADIGQVVQISVFSIAVAVTTPNS